MTRRKDITAAGIRVYCAEPAPWRRGFSENISGERLSSSGSFGAARRASTGAAACVACQPSPPEGVS